MRYLIDISVSKLHDIDVYLTEQITKLYTSSLCDIQIYTQLFGETYIPPTPPVTGGYPFGGWLFWFPIGRNS